MDENLRPQLLAVIANVANHMIAELEEDVSDGEFGNCIGRELDLVR